MSFSAYVPPVCLSADIIEAGQSLCIGFESEIAGHEVDSQVRLLGFAELAVNASIFGYGAVFQEENNGDVLKGAYVVCVKGVHLAGRGGFESCVRGRCDKGSDKSQAFHIKSPFLNGVDNAPDMSVAQEIHGNGDHVPPSSGKFDRADPEMFPVMPQLQLAGASSLPPGSAD